MPGAVAARQEPWRLRPVWLRLATSRAIAAPRVAVRQEPWRLRPAWPRLATGAGVFRTRFPTR